MKPFLWKNRSKASMSSSFNARIWCSVGPVPGLGQVDLWWLLQVCLVFTYSIVGTERVEGIRPTHKQASLSAEQHLHEVTALILQQRQKWREAELKMQEEKNWRKGRQNNGVNWEKDEFIFWGMIIPNEAFRLPDVWNYHTINAVNLIDTVCT